MKKRSLCLLMALGMTISMLAGCGSAPEADSTQKADAEPAQQEETQQPQAQQEETQQEETQPEETQPEEKTYDEHLTITMSLVTTNTDVNSDDFAKFWNDKFNMEWEIIPMSDESKNNEMLNIWVNTGDMPDIANWGYDHSSAMSWTEQDLIKRLPDDWRERWPNVAAAYDSSGVGDLFDEMFGGTYILPKPVYSTNKPVDVLIAHDGVWYRKDWIEKLGFEIKESYTTKEIMEMMRAVRDEDPGEVGETLVPMEIPSAMLPEVFVYPNSAHSRGETQYYQDENGVYQWGPADEATLEGLKLWRQAYDEGLLHPEFYTLPVGRENQAALNQVGRTALNVAAGMATVATRYAVFMRNSLNVEPEEALAYAYVVNEEGYYNAFEVQNFAGSVLLNPNLDDEKFERIMDILDFSATDEGQMIIRMGFEGEDWEYQDDGSIVSLLDEDMQVTQKYACVQPLYTGLLLLPDNFQLVNPTLPEYWRNVARDQYISKTEHAKDILRLDFDVEFYNSKAKQQATLDMAQEYAAIVLKGPDVEVNWRAWVDEKMKLVQPVLDELTEMKKNK